MISVEGWVGRGDPVYRTYCCKGYLEALVKKGPGDQNVKSQPRHLCGQASSLRRSRKKIGGKFSDYRRSGRQKIVRRGMTRERGIVPVLGVLNICNREVEGGYSEKGVCRWRKKRRSFGLGEDKMENGACPITLGSTRTQEDL